MGNRRMIWGLLAACAGVALALPAEAGKRNDTIVFAADQVPESIDSYFNNVRIGVIIAHHVWSNLIYRDPKTNEYKGELATDWKWINDKTIEFNLRHGIKFHNGEPFDADDVVYTLNFVGKAENKVTTQTNVNWIESAESIGSRVPRRSSSTRCASI
jgi:peptide/nickel transport system substrate-binding protein